MVVLFSCTASGKITPLYAVTNYFKCIGQWFYQKLFIIGNSWILFEIYYMEVEEYCKKNKLIFFLMINVYNKSWTANTQSEETVWK